MTVKTYGKMIKGSTRIALQSQLVESRKGKKYQLNIDTDHIPEEKRQEVIDLFRRNLETRRWRIKIFYMEVRDNSVVAQIEGSPFLWAALIPAIPLILKVVGIGVGAIAVFFIIEQVGKYAVPLIVLAVVLLGGGTAYKLVSRPQIQRKEES